jgi:hypothetical protein
MHVSALLQKKDQFRRNVPTNEKTTNREKLKVVWSGVCSGSMIDNWIAQDGGLVSILHASNFTIVGDSSHVVDKRLQRLILRFNRT